MTLLSRQMPVSHGEILLAGEPLARWRSRAFARQVAYLPQSLPLTDGLTVRELVQLGRYPWHGAFGRFSSHDQQQCTEAIALVGLTDLAQQHVDSLSGGERQRAWMAMILAQNSRCVLLDEPTSALDIAHQIATLDLLRQLSRQRNLSVIIILHDINLAARYCDEVVALQRGAIVAAGTPVEIMQPTVLERIYGIPMAVVAHPHSGLPVMVAV